MPEGFQVLPELEGNRLVWNPVQVPDLDHYRIYRRIGSSAPWKRLPFSGSDTTWFDAGRRPDAAYAVTAVDKAGNESPRSEAATGASGEAR